MSDTPHDFRVDLDNCEDEPIHIPGSIQPHGVLIGVEEESLAIQNLSANVGRWFGADDPEGLIGTPIVELVGPEIAAQIEAARHESWVNRLDEVRLDTRPELVAAIHRSGGLLVIEIEHDVSDLSSPLSIGRAATLALNEATTVESTARAAVKAVRAITGFDRVMVYRFDESWNGEVIAEDKLDSLNTFLGLHYPATDIPAQARDLYRRNWIRLIADVDYEPVPLVPAVNPLRGAPLDLGQSTIRSVSPIHIEYLQNMGVTASMSISIVVDGELWGLIACHHYTGPHRPPPAVRNAAEYLGQLVSIRVRETASNDERDRTLELNKLADRLAEAFESDESNSVGEVLRRRESEILKLASATGAIIRTAEETVRLGQAPPDDALDRLLGLRAGTDGDELLVLRSVPEQVPELADQADVAAGAMVVTLTGGESEVLAWFRPEMVQSVDWAGDPYRKEVEAEDPMVRLSPRKSFHTWREVVRGRSQPWATAEINAAHRFARHLAQAMIKRNRDLLQVASDLQRVMLPKALPQLDACILDAHYVSDGSGEVGGDWYDAIVVGDSTLCLVLGDVTGHGLQAASVMAQARNGVRTLLVDHPDPGMALSRLNNTFLQTLEGELATMALVVVDTARLVARAAVAGNLPPILVRDGSARVLPAPPNSLLGLVDRTFESIEVPLQSGDRLIMFSDGVIEAFDESLDDRVERFGLAAVRLGATPIEGLARRLASEMAEGARPDDVTVSVVEIS